MKFTKDTPATVGSLALAGVMDTIKSAFKAYTRGLSKYGECLAQGYAPLA